VPVVIATTPVSETKAFPPGQKMQNLEVPTAVGVRWSALSMDDSSPESLEPQHDAVPPARAAQVKKAPAEMLTASVIP
jgi:hypothetical protein